MSSSALSPERPDTYPELRCRRLHARPNDLRADRRVVWTRVVVDVTLDNPAGPSRPSAMSPWPAPATIDHLYASIATRPRRRPIRDRRRLPATPRARIAAVASAELGAARIDQVAPIADLFPSSGVPAGRASACTGRYEGLASAADMRGQRCRTDPHPRCPGNEGHSRLTAPEGLGAMAAPTSLSNRLPHCRAAWPARHGECLHRQSSSPWPLSCSTSYSPGRSTPSAETSPP